MDEIINIQDFEKLKSSLINDLLYGAPQAQRNIKTFLKNINYRKIENQLINETAETISKIRVSREAQEGLEAFLEKKKPKWKNNAS